MQYSRDGVGCLLGASVRIVVAPEDAEAITARLAEVGARAERGVPDFEDLYLAKARAA